MSTKIVIGIIMVICLCACKSQASQQGPEKYLQQDVTIQQRRCKNLLKQAYLVQRSWSSKHHDNTRGTGKKRPFGEKRTTPKKNRPY